MAGTIRDVPTFWGKVTHTLPTQHYKGGGGYLSGKYKFYSKMTHFNTVLRKQPKMFVTEITFHGHIS